MITLFLWNIRTDCVVLLSGGKPCATTEVPETPEDAKISMYTLFLSCVCVFQLLHALISAWPVFLALHSEAFWLECYLSERCGLSKLKQVNVWMTVETWAINTSHILMVRRTKRIDFSINQATQAAWILAPLQQLSQVRLPLFVSFVCVCFFPPVSSHEVFTVVSSGCPCSGMKRQPVSTNPSPSENSSANASIGSTQSTPTSSMAWLRLSNLHHQQASIFCQSLICGFCASLGLTDAWVAFFFFFPLCVLFKISLKSTSLVSHASLKWTWCGSLS